MDRKISQVRNACRLTEHIRNLPVNLESSYKMLKTDLPMVAKKLAINSLSTKKLMLLTLTLQSWIINFVFYQKLLRQIDSLNQFLTVEGSLDPFSFLPDK